MNHITDETDTIALGGLMMASTIDERHSVMTPGDEGGCTPDAVLGCRIGEDQYNPGVDDCEKLDEPDCAMTTVTFNSESDLGPVDGSTSGWRAHHEGSLHQSQCPHQRSLGHATESADHIKENDVSNRSCSTCDTPKLLDDSARCDGDEVNKEIQATHGQYTDDDRTGCDDDEVTGDTQANPGQHHTDDGDDGCRTGCDGDAVTKENQAIHGHQTNDGDDGRTGCDGDGVTKGTQVDHGHQTNDDDDGRNGCDDDGVTGETRANYRQHHSDVGDDGRTGCDGDRVTGETRANYRQHHTDVGDDGRTGCDDEAVTMENPGNHADCSRKLPNSWRGGRSGDSATSTSADRHTVPGTTPENVDPAVYPGNKVAVHNTNSSFMDTRQSTSVIFNFRRYDGSGQPDVYVTDEDNNMSNHDETSSMYDRTASGTDMDLLDTGSQPRYKKDSAPKWGASGASLLAGDIRMSGRARDRESVGIAISPNARPCILLPTYPTDSGARPKHASSPGEVDALETRQMMKESTDLVSPVHCDQRAAEERDREEKEKETLRHQLQRARVRTNVKNRRLVEKRKQTEELRRALESLQEKWVCSIDVINYVNRLFLPCRHLVCCEECAPRMTRCPICREAIRAIIHVTAEPAQLTRRTPMLRPKRPPAPASKTIGRDPTTACQLT